MRRTLHRRLLAVPLGPLVPAAALALLLGSGCGGEPLGQVDFAKEADVKALGPSAPQKPARAGQTPRTKKKAEFEPG